MGGEGLGLTAAAVQGEHELAVVGLAQRVFGGEGGQLGQKRVESAVGEGQLGVVAPLQEQQSGLSEALDEGVAAQFGRESAEGGAAPEGEGGGAFAEGAAPVPARVGGARGGGVGVEGVDVEFAVVDAEEVAGGHGPQPGGVVEEPTEPGDVVVEGGVGGGGRGAAPERVLERLDGDGTAGFEQEGGQEQAHLRAAHGTDYGAVRAVVVENRRSQQAEPQLAPLHAAHCLPAHGFVRVPVSYTHL